MAVLLVTYDLNKPGQDYSDFYKVIKSYTWARLSESSYAIATSKATKTVYEELAPHIGRGDQLFVIGLENNWHGFGPRDVYDWLKEHLP